MYLSMKLLVKKSLECIKMIKISQFVIEKENY